VLSLSHLRLRLVPERELQLPAYNKGNSLRGGFGAAFRKLVCVDMHWECADCSLRYTCPYTKVFNPFIPPDAPQFSGNQNIPRPFVFKPPLSQQTVYAPGEPLVFDLVVVGQAVDYLPYFIVSFRELGAMGFGLNRVRVRLDRVESIDADGGSTLVYDGANNVVRPAAAMEMEVVGSRYSVVGTGPEAELSAGTRGSEKADTDYRLRATDDALTGDRVPATDDELQATGDRLPATEYVELHFLTPTTLKSGSTADRAGEVVRQPAFHHIIKRLRDRVNALSTFYGGGPLDMDFKALGEAAERVETVADHTRWVERSRVARRRNVTHDLSGFVGSIRFGGHLAQFLPLLRIGEYVHVGKNAVFGNGWFVIEDVEPA